MTIIGIKVIHKPVLITRPSNGEGVISDLNGSLINVKFDSGRVVSFNFPECFTKKVLIAKTESDQNTIMSFINAENERISIEKKLKKDREDKEKKEREIQSKFGSAYHPQYVNTNSCMTYNEVEQTHGIAIRASCKGINLSQNEDSIVLISALKENYTFDYSDYYREDGKFIYTGAGTKGNQKLTKSNLAITTAKADGKVIHLYIRLSSKEYLYQGVFEYESHYFAPSRDKTGSIRNEIKFVLRKA